MSEVGKQDRIGLVVKVAGAVTAVAGAGAAVIALIPDKPPPAAIRGDFIEISTEPDVTLAEYQQRSPYQPKPCANFKSPPAPARKLAIAPRRPGGGVALATARIASGALLVAQSKVDVGASEDMPSTEPRPGRPSSTGTTTTGTTTTGTTTTGTTSTGTTSTGTTTTGTTSTGTTTTPTIEPGGVLRQRSTAAFTLAGARSLSPSQTATLLLSTRTKDAAAAAAAVKRFRSGAIAGDTARKREIASIADDLIGEVVTFRVRIVGLVGRCSYVRWSLYDAKTRRRARESQLTNRDALYFHAEAVEDVARSNVWVGLPRRQGPFFVRLELFKQEGGGLAGADSPRFG
jgi:hypothetical protein